MTTPTITYVLECPDARVNDPVEGKSGKVYGVYLRDAVTSVPTLRMTAAQFEEARKDLFGYQRRHNHIIPRVEIEGSEPEKKAPKEPDQKKEKEEPKRSHKKKTLPEVPKSQDGEAASHQSHNLENEGSNPSPVTPPPAAAPAPASSAPLKTTPDGKVKKY